MRTKFQSLSSGGVVTRARLSVLSVLLLAAGANVAPAQSESQSESDGSEKIVDWQKGPCAVRLGAIANVQLPPGYRCANAQDTIKLLEIMGNPTDGTELGLIMPLDGDWFVTFDFNDVGYVKDDDRDDLDADEMLKSIRRGTEESNKIRKNRGWPEMHIVGWEHPPRYDSVTNNLVWAIRGESEGEPVVNYNTRRLGRSGVMNITLVADPEELEQAIPKFEELMRAYEFSSGNRYSEFRVGDKVAEYGLAALITGGAAAVAVKTGLFKWLWKAIVVGVVAIGGVIKSIFKKKG